jgi:hypothetical protein
VKEYLKKHIFNFKGTNTPKLLLIESDDWGSIRIPNTNVRDLLLEKKLIKNKDTFSKNDTLESSEDYLKLYKVLERYKDIDCNPPVITANFIMANPDFDKIRASHFNEYFYETFTDTYNKYYPNDNTFESLKYGMSKNYIHPQFHGREHLNVSAWLDKLSNNNEAFLFAFYNHCFAIDYKSKSNIRGNLMASYDYRSNSELEFIREGIKTGLKLFEDNFGFISESTIAPCYVWNKDIEDCFLNYGVSYFQGSKFQQCVIPNKNKHKKIWRYIGEKGDTDSVYSIRNCLFEPSSNTDIDWVSKALESIEVAFLWRRPAILGMHRVNFVGGLSQENRRLNLEKLDELLFKVLKKFPDVRFISTPDLFSKYLV